MSCRHQVVWCVLATAIALMSLTPLVAGQASAGAPTNADRAKKWSPARAADGHPNLQGVWNFATMTPLQRAPGGKPFLTREEAAELAEARARASQDRDRGRENETGVGSYNRFWMASGSRPVEIDGVIRSSLIIDPTDGRLPPLTPEGEKALAAIDVRIGISARAEDRPAMERCILGFNAGPPMTPGNYNNIVQIFQNANSVVVLNEMVHNARIIPMDGRPHGQLRQWMGDSRGRWDGDTLVVDTINFYNTSGVTELYIYNGASQQPLILHGGGAGKQMHLVERFKRVDADTIVYEATVDDPATWTRTWTMAFTMTRTDEPLLEYACHEANYALPNILNGVRLAEQSAGPNKE